MNFVAVQPEVWKRLIMVSTRPAPALGEGADESPEPIYGTGLSGRGVIGLADNMEEKVN